jgi:hypothetical protein
MSRVETVLSVRKLKRGPQKIALGRGIGDRKAEFYRLRQRGLEGEAAVEESVLP